MVLSGHGSNDIFVFSQTPSSNQTKAGRSSQALPCIWINTRVNSRVYHPCHLVVEELPTHQIGEACLLPQSQSELLCLPNQMSE
jgi:hypothetical protein